jgi:excisionase family DNA binding protein
LKRETLALLDEINMDDLSNNIEGTSDALGGGRRQPPRRLGEDKLCYTVPEAAKLLGLSRNFGYELARRGEIPIIKFGKRMLVPRAKFDKMLNE